MSKTRTQSQQDCLYREMVKAVREWIAAEHPYCEDRVDVTVWNSLGCGDVLAQFHAHAADAYALGDVRAMARQVPTREVKV